MRVVLLGPNGQLGTDIVNAAAGGANGIDLHGVGRDALDVTDSAALQRVLDAMPFDVLVNCTSYHKTDEVEHNPALAFDVNAHAVERMAAVCAEKGARFVHISTDYVFAGNRDVPYTELDPPGPLNVYGASKLMGETLALKTHGDTVMLRVASLFGVAGASGKGGNFVETMIRVGREKGALRVVDDITMSPTATADVAQALLQLLRTEAPPGVYHVVNSEPATWYQFAVEIVKGAGIRAQVTPVTSAEFPTVAVRPPYSVLDNSKMADLLGPMAPWPDALRRYLHAKGHVPA